VTELGWASGGVPAPLVVDRARQANRLRRSFRYLRRHRQLRISDIQWFAWQDVGDGEITCAFCQYSGLFDHDGFAKPSWFAFKDAAGV
jgi:hypothetical protein